MGEPGWSEVWTLVLALVGRQSIEMQILTWLLVALAAALFVEGVRATFFRRMSHGGAATSSSQARQPSGLPRIGSPKIWSVTEISRTPEGLPRLVAVASQPQHPKKRTLRSVNRYRLLTPGIQRRPFYFLQETAPLSNVTPELQLAPEPEFEAPQDGSDLRFAS